MSQICIVSKQLALIFKASYNSPKTLSVKVLTLSVAAKPTLPAIYKAPTACNSDKKCTCLLEVATQRDCLEE